MRKIIVLEHISLDGVIQAPGGPNEDVSDDFKNGGWSATYGDEIGGAFFAKELQPTDLLLGRKTFDIFEAYWPTHESIWPGINESTKYVLSNTRNESTWNNSVFLRDLSAIRDLKNSDGAPVKVWGSSQLVQLLLKHKLVDELCLIIYPVVLGKGKKLFDEEGSPSAFTLTDSLVTSKGVIITRYQLAGEVVTGSYED